MLRPVHTLRKLNDDDGVHIPSPDDLRFHNAHIRHPNSAYQSSSAQRGKGKKIDCFSGRKRAKFAQKGGIFMPFFG